MNRLNPEASKSLAQILCHKLALDLDANDVSSITLVAPLLEDLPMEEVVAAIRTQIGIERVVKFNLDENQIINDILVRMNNHIRNKGE